MEPRQLLSADVVPLPAEPAPLPKSTLSQAVVSTFADQSSDTAAVLSSSYEIVFVDPRVPDANSLLADFQAQNASGRHLEVITLDPNRDGIMQITEALADRMQVDIVHFITHGSDASVQLGSTWLNAKTLAANAEAVASWGHALKTDGDLLFYGCDLASSARGRALMDWISDLTDADVAASTDRTGAAEQGANWTLEYQHGQIDAQIVISEQEQLGWGGTLQASAIGGETRVNTTTTGTQGVDEHPVGAVAMANDGSYVVVWSGNGTQSGNVDTAGVFAQRYDADGVAQGGEFRVNTTTANNQYSPAVAMDAAGNFVIAWVSDTQDGSGRGVYAQRFNTAGTAQGAEFRVNTTTANDQNDPVVAMASNGEFLIAWSSTPGQDGSGAGVYAKTYHANGSVNLGEFRVNFNTTGDQWLDGAQMDDAGNFVIGFAQADASGFGVFMRRFDAAGNPLSGDVAVNTTTAGAQNQSTVAMASNGDFVVIWTSPDSSGTGIFGQRFDAAGVAQGGEFQVNTTTAGDQIRPKVRMDQDGNFAVVWASNGTDGSGWGVYKREFFADGSPDGAEVRVNSSTSSDQGSNAGDTEGIGLAMAPDGDLVVVWSGNGTQTGQTDSAGVFMQRYTQSTIASFQQGVTSYAGTQDTALLSGTPSTPQGTDDEVSVDGDDSGSVNQGLIRFDNIFGTGPGQIPFGSVIDSVELIFWTTSGTNDTISLHRMLVGWDQATATWNSLSGGLNSGVDYDAVVDGSQTNIPDDVFTTYSGANLRDTVQEWSDGLTTNYGWAMINSGTGGWDFATSEWGGGSPTATELSQRPQLRITWHAAPPTYTVSGTIYHDIDADALVGADDAGATFASATNAVKLFRDNGSVVGSPDATDALAATVNTDVSGAYTFSGVADGTYWLAIDSRALSSNTSVWAEQTYAFANGTSISAARGAGYTTSAGALYGGKSSQTSDVASTAANSEHLFRVVVSGGNVVGADAGFSFNVITNTRDADDDGGASPRTAQGALRQFVQNSNALANALFGQQSSVFRIDTADPNHLYYRNNGAAGFGAAVATTAATDALIADFDPDYLPGTARSWYTITLNAALGALPAISDSMTLSGATQPGFDPAKGPIIELNGQNVGGSGLALTAGASGSTVRSLVMNRFSEALFLTSSSNNVIEGNYIGTDVSGKVDRGNTDDGIDIYQGSFNNTIGGTGSAATRNVISGNNDDGIVIGEGVGPSGNVIIGNYIGTDAAGIADLGNTRSGIRMRFDATGNTVGGATTQERNVISGNDSDGVSIESTAGANNVVQGNYIGVDVTGNAIRANSSDGVEVAASSTIIAGNVISGNAQIGVNLSGGANNRVRGNIIGLGANGDTDLGNTLDGVQVNASNTATIGGTTAAERNIISGNNRYGIFLQGGADGTVVTGNFIGTDQTGTVKRGNTNLGIHANTAINTRIGGPTFDERNVVSGNLGNGINIQGGNVNNVVQGNYVGVTQDGSAALGNTGSGISTSQNTTNVSIIGNVVADNGGPGDQGGLRINQSDNITIQGNLIGFDATGTTVLGNFGAGIDLITGGNPPDNNLIGGTLASEANRIAGSTLDGIRMYGGTNNHILGNSMYGNGGLGIDLGANGPTSNDANDGDSGANDLYNFPTATAFAWNGTNLSVTGLALDAAPAGAWNRIEFFASSTNDGEGQRYLGYTLVMEGAAPYTGVLAGVGPVTTGEWITMTATRTDAAQTQFFQTSEFSAPKKVAVATIPLVSSAPTIDGAVDAVWAAGTPQSVDLINYPTVTSSADLSATWRALWDSTNLYVLVEVTDDAKVADLGPSGPFSDDTVEIFVDGDYSRGAGYDANDKQFGFRWSDPAVYAGLSSPMTPAELATVDFDLVDTGPTSYRLEVSIPWATIGVAPPTPGTDIGIDVQVGDDDDGGERDGKLAWADDADLAYTNPYRFGTGLLVGNTAPVATDDAYTVAEDGSLTVNGGWWDSSWQYRQRLTFDNSGQAENLTDFPLLVVLDPSRIDYSRVQADGGDLRFVDADGTELDYEIESWNPGGTSHIWVRVPQIDASSAADYVWMYYGNAGAADGWNAAGVWSSAFAMVQHLEETSGAAADSTANGNDSIATNGVTQNATGPIAGGDSFDGNDNYLVGHDGSLSLTNAITLSGWYDPSAVNTGAYQVLVNKGTSGTNQNYFLAVDPADEISFGFWSGSTITEFITSTANLTAGAWHHLAATFDNPSNTVQIFLDGQLIGGPYSTTDNPVTNTQDLYIGRSNYSNEEAAGVLDELRIQNIARSAAWLRADHLSQTDALIAYGTAESGAGVLTNDTDADGDPLTAVLVSGPSSAAAFALNPDGSFSYTPIADFYGTDTFTYRANDGTVDSNLATVAITVTPVNDAPVLNTAQTPVLAAVAQDAGVPSGAVGSLVSSLVDFALPAGQVDNVTDVDSGALLGIAITGADISNGSWWYSTDGGTSWNPLGVVADASARLLVADANTRIYFEPAPAFNGTIANAITFRAWDRTSGANGDAGVDTSTNGGTTAFSATTDTAEITITSTNQPPTASNNTVTTPEDTPYVFTAADFNFSDPDAGDTLQSVTINSLPGAGSLKLSGVAVTAGQVIDVTDINAGDLTFTPDPDASGTGYASFDFTVTDTQTAAFEATVAGGTSDGLNTPLLLPMINGGTDQLYVVVISMRNDQTVTSISGGGLTWTKQIEQRGGRGQIDFVMYAAYGSPADFQLAIATNLAKPAAAVMGRFSGTDGVVYAVQTSNTNGQASGPGTDLLAVSGGTDTANPTLDIDPGAANRIIITGVNSRNEAIVAADSDYDATYVNDPLAYGSNGSGGDDVWAQLLARAGAPAGSDNISHTISSPDDWVMGAIAVGTMGSGASSNVATMTIDVDPVPDLIDDAFTVDEDSALTNFAVLANDDPGSGLGTITAVSAGSLGGTIAIAAGNTSIDYTPAPGVSGTETFTYTFTDSNGDADTATVTVTINPVNDPPVVTTSGGAVAYTENDPLTAVDPAVTVTDIDTPTLAGATVQITGGYVPGEDVLSFTPAGGITGVFDLGTGTLTLSGVAPLATWASVLQSVTYQNTSDNPSNAARTVTLIANDGIDSSAPSTRIINVTAVNDVPTVTTNNLTLGNGATVTLSAANLGATDPDNASATLTYSVSGVTNGQFELASAPGVAITTFTAAQLAAGQVVFIHAGNNAAPAYTVTASDGSLPSTPSAAAVTFSPDGGNPSVPPPPSSGGGGTTTTPPSSPPGSTGGSDTDGDDATPLDTPASPSRSSGGGEGEAVAEPVVEAPAAPVRVAAAKETKPTVETEIMTVQSSEPTLAQSSQSFAPSFAQVRKTPEITVELGKISLPENADGDRLIQLDLNSIRMTSLALSVGAIWWATRAAGLITSLLSSLPAWRNFDPLPVLQRNEDEEEEEQVWGQAEEESEEAAEEEAVTQTFEDAQPTQPPSRWRRSQDD